MRRAFLISIVVSLSGTIGWADYWTQPMIDVHANFTGEPGTIARFGDSIFISQAFFVPLKSTHQNVSPETQLALDWIQGYLPADVWGWQSPQTGAQGRKTSDWPLESDQNPPLRNLDHWLNTLNPEMAVIMWGTNDVELIGSLEAYTANFHEIVRTVKDNGTIPILTSIPPRHGYETASHEYAQAIADLALEEGVPLIPFHQEILARAPGDTWDGSLIFDGEGSVFQVERLISGDGIHPSNPTAYRRNFSEDALNKSGYTLLNYMTLRATFDVYQQVIAPDTATLSGDYNGNGIVDAADYTIWRDTFGQIGSGLDADGTGMNGTPDGIVDQLDYDFWKTNFGTTLALGSGAIAHRSAVPEPKSLLLLVTACVNIGLFRRSGRAGGNRSATPININARV